MKRVFDLSFAAGGLLLLGPIIIAVALLIRFKFGSPVLFMQERPGLNEKPFLLYKFRSMTNERDDNGDLLPDYTRLTTFGMLLRKMSLDELPQLYNVLKGDMSFVGPRPLLMDYLPLYTEEQAKRHQCRPGITGMAQINGRNNISWEERFRLDVWYVQNRTLILDIKILCLTAIRVFKSEGVSQAGHETREKYMGMRS
jgi:sugar transferase EpsL